MIKRALPELRMQAGPGAAEGVSEEVKAFFEGWRLYTTVICHNYMGHREVVRRLTRRLQRARGKPLQILELGCGDAHVLSSVAASVPVERYLGIELTEQALRDARRNLEGLVAQACFLQGDMAERMRDLRGSFDVVLAGYTLHHLPREAKRRIFGDFSRVLAPGGIVIVWDLVQKPAESREAYLERTLTYAEAHWQAFSREELERIREHVTQHDYPESWPTWKSLALENGFRRASMAFLDPARLFGFMEFDTERRPAAGAAGNVSSED